MFLCTLFLKYDPINYIPFVFEGLMALVIFILMGWIGEIFFKKNQTWQENFCKIWLKNLTGALSKIGRNLQ